MGEEWREWHEEFKEKKSITAALNETRLELVFPKRYKIQELPYLESRANLK